MALSDNLHQLATRPRHATARAARERAHTRRGATDAGRARITDWRADLQWEDAVPDGDVARRSSAAPERPACAREATRERTGYRWLWLVAGVAWIVALGGIVTATHTAGVFALGFITLALVGVCATCQENEGHAHP